VVEDHCKGNIANFYRTGVFLYDEMVWKMFLKRYGTVVCLRG